MLSTRVERRQWFAKTAHVVIDEAYAFGADDSGWHMLAALEQASWFVGRELPEHAEGLR